MAKQDTFYDRITRLFSTNVIVRNVGGKKLKVVDTNKIQSRTPNNLMDRYTRLYSSQGAHGNYYGYSGELAKAQRVALFRDYEAMDDDPILSSALDIYADECLSSDTIIPLLDGRKLTIKDMFDKKEQDFWLYGLDDTGNFTPVKADKVVYKGKAKVYEIILDDGTKLKSTGNHRWVNGDRDLVHTEDLRVGDGIFALNTKRNYDKLCSELHTDKTTFNHVLRENEYKHFSDFVDSSNHRIISIKRLEISEDVYDIVNAGKNHIYALESNDGSKLYTHNSSMKSEYGNVLEIKTDNPQIHDILHNLFYDILNIEFNLWPWIRNMCKYGDFFLKLDVKEDYGIINVLPMSAYDVSRVEGFNPSNPHEVKYVVDPTDPRNSPANASKTEFENYEIAHFRLLSDSNYIPYGKSMVEGARRVWKQLSLMEDAMLIHRIMRAPEKRIFKVDIGNLPPNEVDTYMKRIIDKMKKVPIVDDQTGEYNLKYNMQNLVEDFYLPVRGGDSGTNIESLPGLTYEAVEDIEYLRNKMMAALRVPKAFLGYEEEVGSKATLAAEDVRFARTIERIQRITVSELTKIAVVHLYSQGYTDAALVDFDLELTNPSTIYEQERLDLWEKKNNIARDMRSESLVSQQWIYDNIFNFTTDDVGKIEKEVINDKKLSFRLQSIENDGNDPAADPPQQQEAEKNNVKDDNNVKRGKSDRDTEDRDTYGVRDVLGKHDYLHSTQRDDNPIKHNYRKSPLALSHYDGLKKHFENKERSVINEVEQIEMKLNSIENKKDN
jgi:hypothetical protein